VNHLNFVGSNHISGTAEARVVKFCIWVRQVKSQHNVMNNKSPLKGAWSRSHDKFSISGPPDDILWNSWRHQMLYTGRLCNILVHACQTMPKGAWLERHDPFLILTAPIIFPERMRVEYVKY